MLNLLDTVTTRTAVPDAGIAVGAVGTIVEVLTKPRLAYLVEFCDATGATIAEEVLEPGQVELRVAAGA